MDRIIPDIGRTADGLVTIDYGKPGPFLALTQQRTRGHVLALARAGWITIDGRPAVPGGSR